jgi:hypothetical protein
VTELPRTSSTDDYDGGFRGGRDGAGESQAIFKMDLFDSLEQEERGWELYRNFLISMLTSAKYTFQIHFERMAASILRRIDRTMG